jgi:hypothetical protein
MDLEEEIRFGQLAAPLSAQRRSNASNSIALFYIPAAEY